MEIALKGFQEDAVAELLRRIRQAKSEVREGDAQAVILASPTGSGKTVITTALMESILDGTDELAAESNAVFVWLSDQPELNEQSRKKIAATTTRFRESDLVILDSNFDQETFDSGKVYFLNTQKLGKDKNLVTPGDNRRYTIWQTIINTEKRLGDTFYLIIDEAHRGMNRTRDEENTRRTIVQKFVLGDQDVIPPINLILGISATPERFQKLLQDTQHQYNRTPRTVQIRPEYVQASGLLKDKIILFHPKVGQPSSDWALLAEAARRWLQMCDEWNAYTTSQGIPPIYPAMVIQVENANGHDRTRTDLAQAIKTIEDEIDRRIEDEELAHSFQENGEIAIGGRSIRKIEASRIQEEIGIKFIFFKMNLTTGWDCPRAEVMMSFRNAQDPTLITQLIGRMIRTPLARRVEEQELLNSVSLYLPHYNTEELQRVIESLQKDPDAAPITEVDDGHDEITLSRRGNCEKVFEALQRLPTYRVEKIRKVSNTQRLIKLSRLLTVLHAIDLDALDESKRLVIEMIKVEKERLRSRDPEFDKKLNGCGEITVRAVTIEQGKWKTLSDELIRVKLTKASIDELFNRAGQRLGEGLHQDYWQANYDPDDPGRPKLELFLTLQNQEVWEKLEKACQERINALFNRHKAAIHRRTSSEQEQYNKIRELAKDPEPLEFAPPKQILVSVNKKDPNCRIYDKHLYVDQKGSFFTILNDWERTTIETEIAREDVIGWFRNYERKPWALSLPYEDAGQTKPMFPDFLIVRKKEEGYVIDILEPHGDNFDDSWKKAKWLAQFARKHWSQFGRIELIRKKGGHLKRLNLNDDGVRERVLGVASNDHLDQLFDG